DPNAYSETLSLLQSLFQIGSLNFCVIVGLASLADVHVGLVDTGLFENIRKATHDIHHSFRGFTIEFKIRRYKDPSGTKLPGHTNRHSRSNPKLPRLIRARRDNATPFAILRVRAHDQCLALQ